MHFAEFKSLWGFAELRKANINFVVYVRPSEWNNSAPSGRSFMKLLYLSIFRKSVQKIQIQLKSDKNNECFTWKPIYIFDHISPSSSQNYKCFRQKL